jgi:transcriptional regulator with XRE-family HTH domain
VLRTERNLTIEGLAHDAELHPTYVSGIERGLSNPSLEVLCKLAGVLDLRVSDLIRRAEDATEDG